MSKLSKGIIISVGKIYCIEISSLPIFSEMEKPGKLEILDFRWFANLILSLIKLMLVHLFTCLLNPWEQINTLSNLISLQLALFYMKCWWVEHLGNAKPRNNWFPKWNQNKLNIQNLKMKILKDLYLEHVKWMKAKGYRSKIFLHFSQIHLLRILNKKKMKREF